MQRAFVVVERPLHFSQSEIDLPYAVEQVCFRSMVTRAFKQGKRLLKFRNCCFQRIRGVLGAKLSPSCNSLLYIRAAPICLAHRRKRARARRWSKQHNRDQKQSCDAMSNHLRDSCKKSSAALQTEMKHPPTEVGG